MNVVTFLNGIFDLLPQSSTIGIKIMTSQNNHEDPALLIHKKYSVDYEKSNLK